MKKLVFLFVAFAAISLASCGNKAAQTEPAVDSTAVETVDTAAAAPVDSAAAQAPADSAAATTPAE